LFQKRKRIIDPDLLALVRKEKCCVGYCTCKAEAAHVKTRGSGGDDVPENLMPLCKWHHAEQHIIGWQSFKTRHPEVKTFDQILAERRKKAAK